MTMKACRESRPMTHVRRFRLRVVFLCFAAIALMARSNAASADDAIYQYAVTVAHRTTYLWVPPRCASVRGLIVAFANLTERQWLEDSSVRGVAARQCLGIVWIGPGDESSLNADMKPGAGQALQDTFKALALKCK